MSDWDASSGDEAPPKKTTSSAAPSAPLATAGRRRFDDEDVEEEVKDDWESSDEEEAPKATGVAPPAKKKMSFKQKLAQKEEEERRRAELGLNAVEADGNEDPLDFDPIARKRAEREAQEQADLENAASLMGFGGPTNGASGAASGSGSSSDPALQSILSAKPSTKEEYQTLAAQIFQTLLKSQQSRDNANYAKHLVPALVKEIIAPIRDVDARKLSMSVKTWADEKTKFEKELKKSGGRVNVAAANTLTASKPKTVGTASAKNTHDLSAYGDEALDDGDDLDFM